MKTLNPEQVKEIIHQFSFVGDLQNFSPYGNGHINTTYLVETKGAKNTLHKYILQRVNSTVFKKPTELMENVVGVTSFLRKKVIAQNGDPSREIINIIPTISDLPYLIDSDGDLWRAYLFVKDSVSLEQIEKPDHFYQSGLAFGKFQFLLADYPAETLHETIKDFHNTPVRFQQLLDAIELDPLDRVKLIDKELEFVMDRKDSLSQIIDQQKSGELPTKVTHNDTKLNNVMLDKDTGEAVCVIDLDTIMPGLSAYDFGDSIRFGASTAVEDEIDLSKVTLDLNLYNVFTKGFLTGCSNSLTINELISLPIGARLMTLECGMRFLTDYISGDKYFKISRPDQNLDRARTQFKLVQEMEEKNEEIAIIFKEYF